MISFDDRTYLVVMIIVFIIVSKTSARTWNQIHSDFYLHSLIALINIYGIQACALNKLLLLFCMKWSSETF